MAWVAVDRAVRTLEEWPDLKGPVDKWRTLRKEIFDEVCEKGYNEDVGAFTQYYGSDQLDASVLMIPLVGFLPPSDPRVVSTVEAIERDLMDHGFVLRYRTDDDGAVDGLTGREGAFLACSFWLVDCLHMIGRKEEAQELFERLLALRNDLGLLSEEYDPLAGRLVGNFPQAFSHVSLINSAFRLSGSDPLALVYEGPRTVAEHTPPSLERIRKLGRVAVRRRSGACPLTTTPGQRIEGRRADNEGTEDGMDGGVMKALSAPLQVRLERWSETFQRQPDDVKVVIEVELDVSGTHAHGGQCAPPRRRWPPRARSRERRRDPGRSAATTHRRRACSRSTRCWAAGSG